ncbi:hypothetical protein BH11MYX1_BH11MYX1_32870 [soil metagenome]
MKLLSSVVALGTLMTWLGVAQADPRPPSPVEKFLLDLPAALTAAKTTSDVRAVQKLAPAGIKIFDSESSDKTMSLQLQFPAKDASWFVQSWKLAHPYALAMDVHQQSWIIELFDRAVEDPHNKRVALKATTFGAWTVRLRLEGRPKGVLPKVVAGASPAYDLATYPARVVGIDIEEVRPPATAPGSPNKIE